MDADSKKNLEDDGFHVLKVDRVYASISKLAEMVDVDRRTATKRLNKSGIAFIEGPKMAKLYPVDISLFIAAGLNKGPHNGI